MKRMPSASSAKNRFGASSSPAAFAAGLGTKNATSAAETRKLAESSQSAFVAPTVATRMPPSGAPTSIAPCWMPLRIPLARSIRIPASSTMSGSTAERAVAPGASRSAPRKTSAMSCQGSIPTVASSSGIPATAPALARSATMLVVRNPSRSTTTPPKNAARTIGTKLKKTTSAVSVALPVVVSTYHGIASCATALPVSETTSAA